jgi:hypothetical protein
MKTFVQQYVKGCATCQTTKSNTVHPRVLIYPITVKPNALPFETIALDLIVDLPPLLGYDSILTITNHDCTKAAFFLPCTQKIDSEELATLLQLCGPSSPFATVFRLFFALCYDLRSLSLASPLCATSGGCASPFWTCIDSGIMTQILSQRS